MNPLTTASAIEGVAANPNAAVANITPIKPYRLTFFTKLFPQILLDKYIHKHFQFSLNL